VPNLDEYHRRLMESGVTCVQPPTATFGVRIAIYKDPDGLEISVSEQKPGG
jgi:predicted enzyme related to lactoylglutathione lyase